jgi:hypothetical protein
MFKGKHLKRFKKNKPLKKSNTANFPKLAKGGRVALPHQNIKLYMTSPKDRMD